MKNLRLVLVPAFFVLTMCTGLSEGLKIGFINMEATFQGYYKTIQASGNIKQQENIYREYVLNMEKEREKLGEEFNRLRDESLNIALSEEVRNQKKQEAQTKYLLLQEKENEMENYNKSKQSELRKQYDKQRDRLVKEISDVVQVYAQNEGYDMILDSSGNTFNGIPAFIYYKPEFEVTEAILALINKGHEQELVTPAESTEPPAAPQDPE